MHRAVLWRLKLVILSLHVGKESQCAPSVKADETAFLSVSKEVNNEVVAALGEQRSAPSRVCFQDKYVKY